MPLNRAVDATRPVRTVRSQRSHVGSGSAARQVLASCLCWLISLVNQTLTSVTAGLVDIVNEHGFKY